MLEEQIVAWVGFNAAVLLLLGLDLLLLHRKPRTMRIREALAWSAVWVGLAGLFCAAVYFMYGHRWLGFGEHLRGSEAALQFLAGYLIELSLSVDNLFVFLAIFSYFNIQGHHQHRVLFWGILGAVVMRAAMILAGVALIHRFEWLLYLLGGFLILTGGRLALQNPDEHADPERSFVLRIARKVLPIATGENGGKFLVRREGRWMVTTLMLVLIVVETTDVVFALDSIPAVLAITKDSFIAYTSNIMAILGLRAMYFALAGLMGLFVYLRYGLAAVLVFVGAKMLLPLAGVHEVGIGVSLGVVVGLLGASVLASLIWPRKNAEAE